MGSFFNQSIIRLLSISKNYVAQEIEKEKKIAQQYFALYRQHAPLPDMNDRIAALDISQSCGRDHLFPH